MDRPNAIAVLTRVIDLIERTYETVKHFRERYDPTAMAMVIIRAEEYEALKQAKAALSFAPDPGDLKTFLERCQDIAFDTGESTIVLEGRVPRDVLNRLLHSVNLEQIESI